jgi:hypothetical protein
MTHALTEETPGIPMADVCAFDNAGWVLICPVCSYEYSHIRSAYTALGQDPVEGGAAYAGTEARGVTPFRRDCLVITVDGECEHVWEIRIQQHKGISYVSTRVKEQAA